MSLTDKTVKDLLGEKQGKVETVSKGVSVTDAARRMADRHIGMLVVVNEMGNFAGVLSDGDIVRAVGHSEKDLDEVMIGDLITTNITACHPGNNLQQILETMKDKSIRHLPVLDGSEIVGVISVGDMLRYLLENFEPPTKGGVFSRLRGG
jgi:CBS domain-containing protein